MNDRDAFLAYARTLRPDDGVLVPARLVIAFLGGSGEAEATSTGALPPADLTVADLASRYGRSKATCRAWVEGHRFPGAYKLLGSREWRVPRSAVEAFDAGERQRGVGAEPQRSGRRPGKPVDLAAWRRSAS